MIRYPAPPAGLLESERFRTPLWWSGGAHVVLALVTAVLPALSFSPPAPAPVYVEVVGPPAPPAAAPAPAPRQVVDEPIVIPKKPRAKPKPKAKPEPKPEPKAEPVKEPAPALTPDQILAQLRAKHAGSESKSASAAQTASSRGIFDPQRAAYEKKIKQLIYQNWVGARPYSLRVGLRAVFAVELDAGGSLRDVRLVQTSGERPLDDSAERAIHKSAPFPPPPGAVRTLRLTFDPREKY